MHNIGSRQGNHCVTLDYYQYFVYVSLTSKTFESFIKSTRTLTVSGFVMRQSALLMA